MNKFVRNFIVAAVSAFTLISCDSQSSVREQAAAENAERAQDISFAAGNAEAENILRRAELVSRPDLIGYVVLLAEGRPVAYYTVRGKITSSGKRLENPQVNDCYDGVGAVGECVAVLTEAPSYDGTYGRTDDYIYFWTTNGQYIQWSTGGGNGYLYSDQPLNPNGEAARALVVTAEE